MNSLIYLLALVLTPVAQAIELNPYRDCVSDDYITFDLKWCSTNLKSTQSPVVEVCGGTGTAYGVTQPTFQITSIIDGVERKECLFSYQDVPHQVVETESCDQLISRYFISAYSRLPRTTISECWTNNKATPRVIGTSTDGNSFEVESETIP